MAYVVISERPLRVSIHAGYEPELHHVAGSVDSTAEPLVQLARVKCRLLERIHKSGTETQLSSHFRQKAVQLRRFVTE
jgi:hypothetical protein